MIQRTRKASFCGEITIKFVNVAVNIIGVCEFPFPICPDARFALEVAIAALSWPCDGVPLKSDKQRDVCGPQH